MKYLLNNKYVKKIPFKALAIFFSVILMIFAVKHYYSINKKKASHVKEKTVVISETPLDRKGYTDSRLNNRTSCFSCEQDMVHRNGEDAAWIGESTKCFDCEGDLIGQTGKLKSAFGT